MNELIVQGITLPQAYHDALYKLKVYGEHVPCPDYNTNQIECSMTMVVFNPLQEPMISRQAYIGPRELEQYRLEILDGILDYAIGYGLDYTYHQRMKNQLYWIIEELKRNPNSRRAVIDIRTSEDMKLSNPACLQHIHFLIRGDRLHMKVLFRSNDACKAAFTNAFGMIMLQEHIANILEIPVGTYTHRANSFHCYERDYDLLSSYVDRIHMNNVELTYRYEGDWKEIMDYECPSILKSLEGRI